MVIIKVCLQSYLVLRKTTSYVNCCQNRILLSIFLHSIAFDTELQVLVKLHYEINAEIIVIT